MKKGATLTMKLLKSFGYAWRGIVVATREQLNIKLHYLAIAVVIFAGLYLGVTTSEWCWLVLCFGMVLSAELFNTAIENLVDLVSPEHHPLAGKVKDIAAGAVIVTAGMSVIIALLIFKKYILLL
jgi:diacylglycerol kinase